MEINGIEMNGPADIQRHTPPVHLSPTTPEKWHLHHQYLAFTHLTVRPATPVGPAPGSWPAPRAPCCAPGSADFPLGVATAIPCSGPCTRPGLSERYRTCSRGVVAAAVGSSPPALGWALSGGRRSGAGVATGPCWRYCHDG